MKKRIVHTIILSALIGSLVLFGSGCDKKVVTPPDGGSDMSGGKNIDYPNADGYSENNLGKDGTLGDTGRGGGRGNLSVNSGDEQSDAYKREHGRCTPGLNPIYFDFDQSNIKSDMTDRLVSNASFIKKQDSHIVIEGNCDERGTNEYNLALGERRAISAKQYLVNLGVDSSKIRTISYGEERPLFSGQDESSYALNRRDDFRVE
jgi:peptidoglycan-associated lipoprotein